MFRKLFTVFLFVLSSSINLHAQKEGANVIPEKVDIRITVFQRSWNAPGTAEFNHTVINNSKYTAIRIGEYYWMERNLNDHLPMLWAEPWNPGTSWTGLANENHMDINQGWLDRDMDRLFIDKSQFQIKIEDFHKYYGRYYTRTDVQYFQRGNNLRVYEGVDSIKTAWKVPHNADFRQLFAMCPVPDSESLGQIAVRKTLSCKAGDNPLTYDIYDPKGGMTYRTYWFEDNSNKLGFNMMPGGSRLNGAGPISNGLGPNNGAWPGIRGDIYHLFHTAKYATQDSQVTIHDWLSTWEGMSWHWYNVRFCRPLTDEELGYRLFINVKDYKENYKQTILELVPSKVDIIKLGLDQEPPAGYYELPKGYLRGFYVQYVLNTNRPRSVKKIVEYLKQVDDDILYNEHGQKVPFVKEDTPLRNTREVKIYPNPVETMLYVDLGEDVDDQVESLEIFSFRGKQILSLNPLERYNDIDLSQLNPGIHVLRVKTTRGTSSYKIIKK